MIARNLENEIVPPTPHNRAGHRWEQFRPDGPHGEDPSDEAWQDGLAHGRGVPGVRRHALTIVFRAR